MMIAWRLSNHVSLDGFGGMVASGRWHSKGRPIVYLSNCSSTALLEILVHHELERELLPSGLHLLEVGIPDDIHVEAIAESDLAADWRGRHALTRRLGDEWLSAARGALLRVPCAVIPEINLLFNPEHPDSNRIGIKHSAPYSIDRRLKWFPSPANPRR
jgi:RES domain-containing protein